jgi:hypothetical protein
MNSNLETWLQSIPTVIGAIIAVLALALVLSWLFLPWTINGHLKKMVKIQEAQLGELELIARNTRPPGSTDMGRSRIGYKTPGL